MNLKTTTVLRIENLHDSERARETVVLKTGKGGERDDLIKKNVVLVCGASKKGPRVRYFIASVPEIDCSLNNDDDE